MNCFFFLVVALDLDFFNHSVYFLGISPAPISLSLSPSPSHTQTTEDAKAQAEEEMWQRIISGCRRLTFFDTDNSMPSHLPREIQKYWAQRYRLFLKYDEGIKLDTGDATTFSFLSSFIFWGPCCKHQIRCNRVNFSCHWSSRIHKW